MNDLNFYDLRGTRINNYQSESLDLLRESSCINLCFSQGSYSYLPNIIIKAHIFFGTKKPELYFNPIGENYSMCLHSFCEICKFWLRQYIDGNRKMINKLSEILYNGEHPVLLKFIPYLKQVILYSDIVNKNIIDSSITKKMMPFSGNKYISAYISKSQSKKNIICLFKPLLKYYWTNMDDIPSLNARCSIFMNFVNENDIFSIAELFPKELYDKIAKICSYIKYKNHLHLQARINIYRQGLDKVDKNELSMNGNNEDEKIDFNNGKEDTGISLSEDNHEEDTFLNGEKNNNMIKESNKYDLVKKKNNNNKINSFSQMLNKKRRNEK